MRPARLWAIAIFAFAASAVGQIIDPTNRVNWTPGYTIGVQGGIPDRTGETIINIVTDYSADNTGATSIDTAWSNAYAAASSNSVIYFPAGVYKITSSLAVAKDGLKIRGAGSNSVLVLAHNSNPGFSIGSGVLSPDSFRVRPISSGATKGSTNLVMSATTNGFGDLLVPGQMLSISQATRNIGTDDWPVLSVANYDRIIAQLVIVHSVSGANVSITAPLSMDFTNAPQAAEFSIAAVKRRMGFEDMTITLTNGTLCAGSSVLSMLLFQGVRDCWITNCNIQFANNYQVQAIGAVGLEIRRSVIRESLSAGTSHAGIVMESASGVWIEDNVFRDGLGPAIEPNSSMMGYAISYNLFTNNVTDIVVHNTHPMFGIYEGNKFNSVLKHDGYFGSYSHMTAFRNQQKLGMSMKRFGSKMQVVGNVIGLPSVDYVYEREFNGISGAGPYPIFEMGYPNIGNYNYTKTNPPVAWNYPGDNYTGAFGEAFTNGMFIFTGTYGPTNVLRSTMGTGTFTNIPSSTGVGVTYALVFQDGSNTNFYYGATNGSVVMPDGSGGSSTTLNLVDVAGNPAFVYVTNGSRLYVAGQNNYQQLQQTNKYTHNITGNAICTNQSSYTLVWSASNTNRVIPSSYIYNAAPSWFGTNRWPAIDPEASTMVAEIPAEQWYFGQSSGESQGSASSRSSRIRGIRLRP